MFSWILQKRHIINWFKNLLSFDRYFNIQNWLRIHPAPKDFVTESLKNFCQFAADCPTLAVVVRPVLKVRPRDGWWIFWFERFIYFKACLWLSTFQISFHFNKYLAICKKIFAAKRAPWRHGRGGHWFLPLSGRLRGRSGSKLLQPACCVVCCVAHLTEEYGIVAM